ncbi:protein SENESCENCE-ASSOCIATED GENE 21, mitochondrial-like [Miscanthus floridulus]|uniref:protein SENESCENCE-ASSOCIATED GENE 21, mitochondrial-like n=1 Tax=Miscanthus floridulus TaxID=154761 RepID=UPI00345AF55A
MALVALSASSTARAVLASLAPRAASRGYAASAASGAMRRAAAAAEGAAGTGEAKEAGRRAGAAAGEISWVPDPVTGDYRPANWAAAVDPADLRAAHLARA